MNSTLREAMGRVTLLENAEDAELRPTVDDIRHSEDMEQVMMQQVALIHDEAASARKKKMEEEAVEHQRQLDGALADAIEIVARHRTRLGRRVCSRPDGAVVRQMFDLLKGMSSEVGADNDPAFGNNHSNADT
jgi:hypothetical protein